MCEICAANHSAFPPSQQDNTLAELAVDELKRLRAIDADILLMVVGIIAIAAVRVLGIAVGLDLGGIGTHEARVASVKLAIG